MQQLQESKKSLNDNRRLSSTLRTDGYLFFRHVVDKRKILKVKREMMRLLVKSGYIKPSVSEPIWTGSMPIPDVAQSTLFRISNLESINELAHSKEIISVFHRLMGRSIFVFGEKVPRYQTPGAMTAPHHDYFLFRGSPEFYIAWIPLMDITNDMGGLSLASGSHVLPFEESWYELESKTFGPAIRESKLETEWNGEWLKSEYSAGDLLIFSSLMIHRSFPNKTHRLRLSIATRYQTKGAKMDWKASRTLEDNIRFKEETVRSAVKAAGLTGTLAERVIWKLHFEGGRMTTRRVLQRADSIGNFMLPSAA